MAQAEMMDLLQNQSVPFGLANLLEFSAMLLSRGAAWNAQAALSAHPSSGKNRMLELYSIILRRRIRRVWRFNLCASCE